MSAEIVIEPGAENRICLKILPGVFPQRNTSVFVQGFSHKYAHRVVNNVGFRHQNDGRYRHQHARRDYHSAAEFAFVNRKAERRDKSERAEKYRATACRRKYEKVLHDGINQIQRRIFSVFHGEIQRRGRHHRQDYAVIVRAAPAEFHVFMHKSVDNRLEASAAHRIIYDKLQHDDDA